MLRCLETTPYTGRISILYDRNTTLFNDRTVRISAPDIRTVSFDLSVSDTLEQKYQIIPYALRT